MDYSDNSSSMERVPCPISIYLYNLLPRNASEPSSNRFFRRPDHSDQLLLTVRLEIFVEEGSDEQPKETVVYSSTRKRTSPNPIWDHLNERVEDWDGSPQWYDGNSTPYLRIVVVNNDGTESPITQNFPLLPKLLRRLPTEKTQSWNSANPPPKSLPPNSILVVYSDDSTRVEPPLFHLLDQKNIIQHNESDASILKEDDEEENRRTARFDDNAFTKLDPVALSPPRSQRSLLEMDDETLATPVRSTKKQERHKENESERGIVDAPNSDQPPIESDQAKENSRKRIELDATIFDFQQEKNRLEALLAEEETFLAEETKELENSKSNLQVTISTVADILEETSQIRAATKTLREEHPNLESSIELQKIFLMHELETIYPITSSGENRYQILSIELPRNFQNIDSNEDEVSAALGFICHSVVMMSKYLSVPLRYRIVCNSSRSAIQEDGTKIMPLFQSRVVERDQLNRGVQLLTRNIDCILESRRIPIKEGAHMLAKLKDIYDGVKAF